jgi:hypothetical protein
MAVMEMVVAICSRRMIFSRNDCHVQTAGHGGKHFDNSRCLRFALVLPATQSYRNAFALLYLRFAVSRERQRDGEAAIFQSTESRIPKT